MAISDISLTAGMRSNLLQLQQTAKLTDRTQVRLSTGKEVNSAIDNPTNFFAAKSHMDRAGDLDGRKDAMGEAIQAIKSADNGITAIQAVLETMRGIVQSAQSADSAGRGELAAQYNELINQIDFLQDDSAYKGTNLIQSGVELDVLFDEKGNSFVTISGQDARAVTGLSLVSAENAAAWDTATYLSALSDVLSGIDVATEKLRTYASKLATNSSIITIRQDFTDEMISTLQEGADNLTLADTNQEGANMLMLQTRQQLGITSLSLSSQAAQAVLGLF